MLRTRDLSLIWGLTTASVACHDFEAGSWRSADAGGGAAGQPTSSTSANGGAGAPPNADAQAGTAGTGALGGSMSGPGAGGEAVEPLEPSAIEGLTLWLTAGKEWCSEVANHEVTSWTDRSSHHNDAKERRGVARPKYLEITLTGHPSLRFEAAPSNLVVPDHRSLRFGEGDFAYVVVARLRNDPQPAYDAHGEVIYAGSGSILSKLEAPAPHRGIAMFANYPTPDHGSQAYRRLAVQLSLGGVLTLSYTDRVNDDVFRVYTARRKAGSDIEIRINGEPEGRSMISGALDVSAEGSDLLIGGWGIQPFAGDISEIVALRGSIDDRQLAGLERGLLEKYRL
ncbi:MAG TPA: hypothetical protein VJN18_03740 [Polyangiaceae bacterium]|nr:hypothetical protein [Polyangiaceae bacterium]